MTQLHDPLTLPDMVAGAFTLSDTTAIVTGAGSVGAGIGIGRAAAILLAEAGAKVGLLDIDETAAAKTLEVIEARGGTGCVVACDMADDTQVADAVCQITDRYGSIQTLVNNVGIVGPPGTAEDVDLGAWDAAMRINVTAMAIAVRHVAPHMRRAGGGSIVNIASITGMGGGYPGLFYPTSKGATISLTRTMAAHYGHDGIRVNAVAPGQLLTPRITARGVSDEMRRHRTESSPLGTEGTGWDAGYAVLYLASPAARWVTGTLLPVDGGVTAVFPLQSPEPG